MTAVHFRVLPQVVRSRELGLLMLLNIVYGIANGPDVLGVLVLDLEVELLLHGHDHFDEIERIRVQVTDELGTLDNLVRLNAEPFRHDPLNPLQYGSQT